MKNKLPLYATEMNLTAIILSKRKQTQRYDCIYMKFKATQNYSVMTEIRIMTVVWRIHLPTWR